MIVRVMENTGAMVQDCGSMYKAVNQSVLLYGSESLVVTGYMLKVLERLHHQATRKITGMTETRGAGGEWEYPQVVAEM